MDRLELIRLVQVAQAITVDGALAYLLGSNFRCASEAATVRVEHFADPLRGLRILLPRFGEPIDRRDATACSPQISRPTGIPRRPPNHPSTTTEPKHLARLGIHLRPEYVAAAQNAGAIRSHFTHHGAGQDGASMTRG